MLANLVREFCKGKNYEVYENYPKRETIIIGGEVVRDETYITIGIIIGPDDSVLEALDQFFSDIIEKGLFEQVFDEIEGFTQEAFGPDSVIVCFPSIQDYQPLQP